MTGHLGYRVSALLDGQLPPEEAERAWAHVHSCHVCRDQVEREGWVKTQLAGWSFGSTPAPDELKGALRGMPPGDVFLTLAHDRGHSRHRLRRTAGLAAIGGGAAGAAVMGILALGAAPADAPSIDRRTPTFHVTPPTPTAPRLPIRSTG